MRHWFTPSFLLAAALLLGAEGIARLFFSESLSGRFDYGYHPTAGFHDNRDGSVSLQRVGGRKFIPQTFPRECLPGVFRVMTIGNSVPYGPERLEDSFPWMIGEQLRKQGVPAEGINLAVVGHGASRNQIVLRRALAYHPGLVVLQVDDSTQMSDEIDFKRRAEFLGWHPRVWLMKSLVVRRLYEWKTEKMFWEWLPDEIRLRAGANDLGARLRAGFASEPPDAALVRLEKLKTTIREDVGLARSNGVPVLLLTRVELDRSAAGEARFSDGGLDAFSRSLTGPGIYQLSMKDMFTALPPEAAAAMFTDKHHLARPGQEAVAQSVVRFIREHGLSHP